MLSELTEILLPFLLEYFLGILNTQTPICSKKKSSGKFSKNINSNVAPARYSRWKFHVFPMFTSARMEKSKARSLRRAARSGKRHRGLVFGVNMQVRAATITKTRGHLWNLRRYDYVSCQPRNTSLSSCIISHERVPAESKLNEFAWRFVTGNSSPERNSCVHVSGDFLTFHVLILARGKESFIIGNLGQVWRDAIRWRVPRVAGRASRIHKVRVQSLPLSLLSGRHRVYLPDYLTTAVG